jgi:hypothetical protein
MDNAPDDASGFSVPCIRPTRGMGSSPRNSTSRWTRSVRSARDSPLALPLCFFLLAVFSVVLARVLARRLAAAGGWSDCADLVRVSDDLHISGLLHGPDTFARAAGHGGRTGGRVLSAPKEASLGPTPDRHRRDTPQAGQERPPSRTEAHSVAPPILNPRVTLHDATDDVALLRSGKGPTLPSVLPLGTGRASFPASGSSIGNAPCGTRGAPPRSTPLRYCAGADNGIVGSRTSKSMAPRRRFCAASSSRFAGRVT